MVSIQEGTRGRTQSVAYSDPIHLDVRDVWETVRIGIEEILYQNQQLTFRPEDVYVELIEKRSLLFMSEVGWMVLSVEVDQFTNEKTLLIWLAYTYKTGGHQWMAHEEWLNYMALTEGCSYIEARSAVPELEPYAIKNGWTLNTRVYTREVNLDGR